jgi:hypothetical protein
MVSTVEIFDPRANSWRISSPFSVPRGYGCAVTANDNVYLIGGINATAENIETVRFLTAFSITDKLFLSVQVSFPFFLLFHRWRFTTRSKAGLSLVTRQ